MMQTKVHVEHRVTCVKGHRYCIICHPAGCPTCGEKHIKSNLFNSHVVAHGMRLGFRN